MSLNKGLCPNSILTLSWRRPLSYKSQSIDLFRKSMDWFLYVNGLRYERVERINHLLFPLKLSENLWFYDVVSERIEVNPLIIRSEICRRSLNKGSFKKYQEDHFHSLWTSFSRNLNGIKREIWHEEAKHSFSENVRKFLGKRRQWSVYLASNTLNLFEG